jgi:hypothetical protein
MKFTLQAIAIILQLSLASNAYNQKAQKLNQAKLKVLNESASRRSEYEIFYESIMIQYQVKFGKEIDPFLVYFKQKADLILADAVIKGKKPKSADAIDKLAKQTQHELIKVLQAMKK